MPQNHHLSVSKKDINQVCRYIENYWPKLIRSNKKDVRSLIGLPHPYVVPTDAGDVFQEQYYWDSYLVMRALINDKKYWKLAKGMVENFFYMIERFGIIPNASRLYFLSRSQPPLLSSMVGIVYDKTRDLAWLRRAARYVEYEYENVWMGKMHLANYRQTNTGLSRYYDINAIDSLAETESGWDMTARFDGKCLSYVPVDLNCLLYLYEVDLAHFYRLFEDRAKEQKYLNLSKKRARLINKLMWDERTGYYYDYNFIKKQRSHLMTVAGVYPLNVGLASHKQAEKVRDVVKKTFQCDYGVVQSVRFVENFQWDWPNGWAPLQLRTIEGLMRYGYNRLAKRLIMKWLSLNINVFKKTGFLWEKYDVVHGRVGVPDRYPTPYGFAWTNAVFLIMVGILEQLSKEQKENSTPLWLVRRIGWF